MAIATLIAAGRLDDRLVERALGLLRELDPKAALPPLDRRGRRCGPALLRRSEGRALGDGRARRRGPRRSAGRAALEAAARRRHGFDHHRPGMHRRARRLCRPQGKGRADHRARDAGRARFPRRAARAGPAARRASTSARSSAASTSGSKSPPARKRSSRRCARAGRAACSSRAASCPSPSRSPSAVGFDRVKANRLVFTGGKLSGEVGDPIVDAMAKRDALDRSARAAGPEPRGRARRRRRRKRQADDRGSRARDRLPRQAGAGRGRRRRAQTSRPRRACSGCRASAAATGSGADYFAGNGEAGDAERVARGLRRRTCSRTARPGGG